MQHDRPSPSASLQKLFTLEANTRCFHCGRPSKQWAQLTHAIILCLNCAATFRDFSWITQIKSINLDEWSHEEVERMEHGGNQSFGKFLKQYGLELAQVRIIVTCRASAYYRAMLDGKAQGQQPTLEEGRMVNREDIPITDMSPEEILDSAKEKALWLGSKTKELGQIGFRKVQEKIESGEIQEGAKKVASSVSSKAKWLWGVVRDKVGQMTSEDKK